MGISMLREAVRNEDIKWLHKRTTQEAAALILFTKQLAEHFDQEDWQKVTRAAEEAASMLAEVILEGQ